MEGMTDSSFLRTCAKCDKLAFYKFGWEQQTHCPDCGEIISIFLCSDCMGKLAELMELALAAKKLAEIR